jgi:hypothetical protein
MTGLDGVSLSERIPSFVPKLSSTNSTIDAEN